MAGRKTSSNGAATTPRKRAVKREYVVVRVEGPTSLTVVGTKQAKSAQAACDAATADLPPADRNVEHGAFLASSYRQKRYSAEQVWNTNSVERPPLFEVAPEPVAT